jgi:hypothetical protein
MDRATGDHDEVSPESLEQKYGLQPSQEPESEPGPEQPPEGGWYADTPHEPSGTDGLGVKALRVALWIIAVVAALYVGSIFWDGLEAAGYHGDDSQRWIVFGGLAALAASILACWPIREPHPLQRRGRAFRLLMPTPTENAPPGRRGVSGVTTGRRDICISIYVDPWEVGEP